MWWEEEGRRDGGEKKVTQAKQLWLEDTAEASAMTQSGK